MPTGSKSARGRLAPALAPALAALGPPAPGRVAEEGAQADAGRTRSATMAPMIATGTLTRKEARHPASGPSAPTSAPDMTGPTATETPTIPPNIPKARPRRSPAKYCWIMPVTWGLSSPEPTPMSRRARLRARSEGARPDRREPVPKTTRPATNRRPRPSTSPARPAATRRIPKTSA